MVEQRAELRGKVVYVVVGPLRFSTLHKSRRECVFTDHQLHDIKSMFQPFYNKLNYLNIKPIICPIFPMDFVQYNERMCRAPIMKAFYEEWNLTIMDKVEEENRLIFQFNDENGNRAFTPCIHRRIFRKRGRKRSKYSFRSNQTKDGLHVTSDIVNDWNKQFNRVIEVHARMKAVEARKKAVRKI